MCLRAQQVDTLNERFKEIYTNELSSIYSCQNNTTNELKVCSDSLRNEGNGPFILHARDPKALVVLFHGLSDSPFFLKSIAEFLQAEQYTTIVGLLPGHGLKNADDDMEDPKLKSRWLSHAAELIMLAETQGLPVFTGGFSTGAAIATHHVFHNPNQVTGLLVFSGAFQLSDNAESISRIWGSKWVAKIVDGNYISQGPNPYKYPNIPLYGALVLMDIIRDIRANIEQSAPSAFRQPLPIFAAHSMSDKTTLLPGVKYLMTNISGEHSLFTIDESYELCHADLPISSVQLIEMSFDKSQLNVFEKCAVPQANPLHRNMLNMLGYFLQRQLVD